MGGFEPPKPPLSLRHCLKQHFAGVIDSLPSGCRMSRSRHFYTLNTSNFTGFRVLGLDVLGSGWFVTQKGTFMSSICQYQYHRRRSLSTRTYTGEFSPPSLSVEVQ